MKYTGPIFRPPVEASTVLLQVTVGCAHNKCTFCTMYKDTSFQIEQIDQIENDLKEIKKRYGSIERIFLINGDAFVLSARRLNEISNRIIHHFPNIKTITMYASIRNIVSKSDEALIMLQQNRINELWIGLETGTEEVLNYMNKGYDLNAAYTQLQRLKKSGIRYNGIFMLGAAGKGKAIDSASNMAKLINKTKPKLIGLTSLGVFPGSQLELDVKDNRFTIATELEVLQEEKQLIKLLTIDDVPFYGSHPINAVSIDGILPRDKEKMIQAINDIIDTADDDFLNNSIVRTSL